MLIPARTEQSEALYKLVNDNRQFLKDYFPVTAEEIVNVEAAERTIISYRDQWRSNKLRLYFITDDNAPCGLMYFRNIDERYCKCELAYFIDDCVKGKGITTKALEEAADIAFNELDMNKVFCKIDTKNTSSRRVAEKSGFKLEGVLRQDFRIADGTLVDIAYYGLLKEDL